jgi:hypothetical protein
VPVTARWGTTLMVLGAPAAPPAESSTRMTKEEGPIVVGLPDTLPADVRARPAGSKPVAMVHL